MNKYGLDQIETYPFELSIQGVNESSLRVESSRRGLKVQKDNYRKKFIITKKQKK
jgi:hypothetical protein